MEFYIKEHKNEAGDLHRVNGPAREWDNGDGSWWYDGEVHRYYGAAWQLNYFYEYWIFDERIK